MTVRDIMWFSIVLVLVASARALQKYVCYPVVHIRAETERYQFSWNDAWSQCNSRGLTMATPGQLQEAWRHGYDKCACGWLADGSVGYPIRTPRQGCGEMDAGIRNCPSEPETWNQLGWDVFCSTKTLPITHFKSPVGHYQLTWEEAKKTCEDNNFILATPSQLQQAWKNGYDNCACGWLADGSVQYPINKPRQGCETNDAGLRSCPVQPWNGVGWDVYCYNGHVNVVHLTSPAGAYKLTWDQARDLCTNNGLNMATSAQLQEAFDLGYDDCSCGWLADGRVQYPIQNPRGGCGTQSPGLRSCPEDPSAWGTEGWDVYCSTLQAPVTYLTSYEGHYKLSWEAAKQECQTKGMPMASLTALTAAQEMGYDMCACGWLADGSVHYPVTKPRYGCGTQAAGVRHCPTDPSDWNVEGYDVYCGLQRVPVVHMQSRSGRYKLSQENAESICAQYGMAVATPDELQDAQAMGYDECACGWLSDGTAGYPINRPRSGCGSDPPGIRTCSTDPTEYGSEGWDVYCSF